MPKAFPWEFRRDVVAVAREGEAPLSQLAKDFGIKQQVWSVFSKWRGLARQAGPPVHEDLVQRQFAVGAPDRVWLTGITEHPDRGKLYLCALKDVCSGRIGAVTGVVGTWPAVVAG